MTLRDFIQTEIEAGNVFDIEEFWEKLHSLNCEGEEEIEPEEFEDYLDYNLDSAAIIHDFEPIHEAIPVILEVVKVSKSVPEIELDEVEELGDDNNY